MQAASAAVLRDYRPEMRGMEIERTGLHPRLRAKLEQQEAGFNLHARILLLDSSHVDPLSGEMAF